MVHEVQAVEECLAPAGVDVLLLDIPVNVPASARTVGTRGAVKAFRATSCLCSAIYRGRHFLVA